MEIVTLSKRVVNTGSEPFEKMFEQLDSLLNEGLRVSDSSLRPMEFSEIVESWDRVSREDGSEICPNNIPPQARDVLSKLLAAREQLRGICRQLDAPGPGV